MNDFPEWIKLVPNGINSFESTNRQNNHSKKYIRADVAAQRIRELEEMLSFVRRYFDKPAHEVDAGYTKIVIKKIDLLLGQGNERT